MHDMQKRRETPMKTSLKLCRLSEFGECEKWFKPNRPHQDFCHSDHQQKYWKLVRKEKRLLVKKVMEHDRRIEAIEKRLGMK